MAVRHLEVEVRREPAAPCSTSEARSTASLRSPRRRLHRGGEREPEAIILNFEGVDYIKLDRDRPDRRPACAGARHEAPSRGIWPERPLRRDLQHHPPL